MLDGVTVDSQTVTSSVRQVTFTGLKPGAEYIAQVTSSDGAIQLRPLRVQTSSKECKECINYVVCCVKMTLG